MKLDYGSAKVRGQLFQDQVCLQGAACAKQDFLALYQAEGFENEDGVLGLAMHPDEDKKHLNFVWQLKNSGAISHAMVSFSVAGPGMSDASYADFGGFDESQVVGGVNGIRKMATMGYRVNANAKNNWALQGESVFYGLNEYVQLDKNQKFPALIDTGSSTIVVPDKHFQFLQDRWENDLKGDLDCKSDSDFCHTSKKCEAA